MNPGTITPKAEAVGQEPAAPVIDWQSLYRRMRNCAAGYSNYCDETGTTRSLDREFEQIDADARAMSTGGAA